MYMCWSDRSLQRRFPFHFDDILLLSGSSRKINWNSAEILMPLGRQLFGKAPNLILLWYFNTMELVAKFGDDRPSDPRDKRREK